MLEKQEVIILGGPAIIGQLQALTREHCEVVIVTSPEPVLFHGKPDMSEPDMKIVELQVHEIRSRKPSKEQRQEWKWAEKYRRR
jgi:hypothetical protein